MAAIEHARARSLLDDLNLSGADLSVGRSPAERQQIRKREGELKAQAAAMEQQWAAAKDDCELAIKDCELAILSACETNYGPQQKGEGVWALSRGFLVAGARRVVASNWLVDDEAGSESHQSVLRRYRPGPKKRRCAGLRRGAPKGQAMGAAAGEMGEPLLLGNVRARGGRNDRFDINVTM